MWFEALVFAVAVAAAGIASVTGFGIGSLLTPLLASRMDAKVAVAAVSVPHLVGTAFRLWLLGKPPDRQVLWSFGITSALGGLTGALLHAWASSPALMIVFGALLLLVGTGEVTGLGRRLRFHGVAAWVAGGLSGFLGGLVGNQGGIRSAALLGFSLDKHAFVATATAIGLFVDTARMPVYFWLQHAELARFPGWIALATLGVMAGTVVGSRLLVRIPERGFRRVVGVIVGVLGAIMLARGAGA